MPRLARSFPAHSRITARSAVSAATVVVSAIKPFYYWVFRRHASA